MSKQIEEIKKRMSKRRQEKKDLTLSNYSPYIVQDEEKHGYERMNSYDGYSSERTEPFVNKEMFLFKAFVSIIFVLIVAIIFKNDSALLEAPRKFVKTTMEREFEFATVNSWYEAQFGSPLSFLPTVKKEKEVESVIQPYATPATGKVMESFDETGEGITIEVNNQEYIAAMSEGFVIHAGPKGTLGNTVIIQHSNGQDTWETWYGNLNDVSVNVYDFVESGKKIGDVIHPEGEKGTYYFAIKQGDFFIDPTQVISFE